MSIKDLRKLNDIVWLFKVDVGSGIGLNLQTANMFNENCLYQTPKTEFFYKYFENLALILHFDAWKQPMRRFVFLISF